MTSSLTARSSHFFPNETSVSLMNLLLGAMRAHDATVKIDGNTYLGHNQAGSFGGENKGTEGVSSFDRLCYTVFSTLFPNDWAHQLPN